MIRIFRIVCILGGKSRDELNTVVKWSNISRRSVLIAVMLFYYSLSFLVVYTAGPLVSGPLCYGVVRPGRAGYGYEGGG